MRLIMFLCGVVLVAVGCYAVYMHLTFFGFAANGQIGVKFFYYIAFVVEAIVILLGLTCLKNAFRK